MKTYKDLFQEIVSFENLLLAAKKARKGKRFKASTALFDFELERELLLLQEELQSARWRCGPYHDFFVFDPKRRLISAAPYRDRVVHHAVCNVIEPLFEKSFIYDTYACRRNKGAHAAADRFQAYATKYRYVLKCDVVKYFSSIDHQILFAIISRKIVCRKTLALIQNIIESKTDKTHCFRFPGDDLFSPFERKKGIPLGNLTSQFFANVYLNGFDHFMKEELKLPYIRYVDDFVIFGNSRKRLSSIKKRAEGYLNRLRLKLHDGKSRVYRVNEGVAFLGYRIFPTHRRLAQSNVLQMRRKLRALQNDFQKGKIPFFRLHQSIQSWIGHASHADTWRLREKLFQEVTFSGKETGGTAGRFVEQQ